MAYYLSFIPIFFALIGVLVIGNYFGGRWIAKTNEGGGQGRQYNGFLCFFSASKARLEVRDLSFPRSRERRPILKLQSFFFKGRMASLLDIGTGFHPELSGRENVYLYGAIMGIGKSVITLKLDEIFDFSGVERYIDKPVKRYMRGMYGRLAFPVAAHLESEILIVGEVLAVGHAEVQKKCLEKIF